MEEEVADINLGEHDDLALHLEEVAGGEVDDIGEGSQEGVEEVSMMGMGMRSGK